MTWYSKIKSEIFFVGIFFLLTLIYQYPQSITEGPFGIHAWRQADGASMAFNYYQNGMKFFKPEIHFLSSDNGTTGYAGAEFPILYYVVAMEYHIFGHHDFLFRLTNLVVFFIGLWFLRKLFILILADKFWANLLPLFFFSTLILVFYANSFLTDTTALAMAFISLYFYFKTTISNQLSDRYRFALFLCLAILLKANMVFVFGMLLAFDFLLNIKQLVWEKKITFINLLKQWLPILLAVIAVVAWYQYISNYNKQHGTNYFTTSIRPIWGSEYNGGMTAMELTKKVFKSYIGHLQSFLLLPVCLLLLGGIIFTPKKTSLTKTALLQLLFVTIGLLTYVILFFVQFIDHDYYYIVFYLFFALCLITIFNELKDKQKYPKLNLQNKYFKIVFVVFLSINVLLTESLINERYKALKENEHIRNKNLRSMEAYLRQLDIKPSDPVISVPDPSPNITLYYMHQIGFTELSNLSSPTMVQEKINQGAKYLIVNNSEALESENIKPFTTQLIGQFKDIYIFDVHRFKFYPVY